MRFVITHRKGAVALRRLRAAAAVGGLALAGGACSTGDVAELNGPTEDQYTTISDRSQLQALATGLLDGDRSTYATEVVFFSIIGRDLYRIDPAESRYITNLLSNSLTDNSNFVGGGLFNAPYRTIRGADLLINAVSSSTAISPTNLTAPEKSAINGFARTVKALQYIHLIRARDTVGVAIQTNADAVVPIRCEPAVLAYVGSLLDSAATDLRAAGSTPFPFNLPTGFAGFTTPDAPSGQDFLQFNRGLKGIVQMYRGFLPLRTSNSPETAPNNVLLDSALTALGESAIRPTRSRAELDLGVYYVFGTGSGETLNPLVDLSVFRVNPKVITQGAEPGDVRIQAKVDTVSGGAIALRGISSKYLVKYPGTATDRLALLKNSELLLTRAQVLWGLRRDAEALAIVNDVRAAAGLPARTLADFPAYTGVQGDARSARVNLLVNGILKEKRYELLFESPVRWVDFRTMGVLRELGTESISGVVRQPLRAFPITNNEVVARGGAASAVCQ